MATPVTALLADGGTVFIRHPDGRWRASHDGLEYELERRRRNPKDGCPDTGWYLYGGPAFGAWCSRLIQDAVDAADRIIREHAGE